MHSLYQSNATGNSADFLISVQVGSVKSIAVLLHPFDESPAFVMNGECPAEYLISSFGGVSNPAQAVRRLVASRRSRGREVFFSQGSLQIAQPLEAMVLASAQLVIQCIATFDNCRWSIATHAAQKPLHELFGGDKRGYLRVCACALSRRTPDAHVEIARSHVGLGSRAVKFGCGGFGVDPDLDRGSVWSPSVMPSVPNSGSWWIWAGTRRMTAPPALANKRPGCSRRSPSSMRTGSRSSVIRMCSPTTASCRIHFTHCASPRASIRPSRGTSNN